MMESQSANEKEPCINNSQVIIYVLELTNNKYYVGRTCNSERRIQQHFEGEYGSEWTRKYKPIKVLEVIENCDHYDEDKFTFKYMDMFGVDNVRGGAFVTLKLDNETKRTLEKMKKGRHDLCFHCGKPGHLIRYCPCRNGQEDDSEEDDSEDDIISNEETCFVCLKSVWIICNHLCKKIRNEE